MSFVSIKEIKEAMFIFGCPREVSSKILALEERLIKLYNSFPKDVKPETHLYGWKEMTRELLGL